MSFAAMQPTACQIPVHRLGETERLFLWCVRSWVQGLTQRVDSGHEIRSALAGHRAEDAAGHLDAFMMVLATGARATVGVRLRRATGLGRDEIVLIRALHACLAGQRDLAGAILDLLVGGTPRRLALVHLERVSAVFEAVALAAGMLPRPDTHDDAAGARRPRRPSTGGRPDAA